MSPFEDLTERPAPPASPLTISAATERVTLNAARHAEATFTVTNQGPVDQRLVLDIVTEQPASRAWYTVVEPQVLVPHGGSHPFLVRIDVPAGTPAGGQWFAARVYSADRAPEETSVVSDRVAFELAPSVIPQPWWRRWWWVFVVAALALVTIAVVLFLVLGGEDPPPEPPAPTTTSAAAEPSVVRRTGSVSLNQKQTLDLDELVVAGASQNDLLYTPLAPSDGFIVPVNGATLAKIGATTRPGSDCARTPLGSAELRISTWQLGEVLCVRTNAGRLAFVVLKQKLSLLIQPPPPPQLSLLVTTFE